MTEDKSIEKLMNLPLSELIVKYPYVEDYIANMRLEKLDLNLPFALSIEKIDEDILEEFGQTKDSIQIHFISYLHKLLETKLVSADIDTLTICGGQNKIGEKEEVVLTIKKGDIISIVGPTGSGKSRLLEDIECLAQKDTPTKRQILINFQTPNDTIRFSSEGKLVAQLSQNMNFVMDITVKEFLTMHAKSRMIHDIDAVVRQCYETANTLAGEKFSLDVKVTQLSGGQSRSLMIADTALMSSSPIILIDEIENAGIDRKQAIELLARNDKIVLMSTHDPLLSLHAKKRIVISNGGIEDVLETSEEEKESIQKLEKIDLIINKARNLIRYGKRITKEITTEEEN